MADSDVIKVSGLDVCQQKLYQYSQQLGDRVVLASLKQGARIVLRSAKAGAPVSRGGKKTKAGFRKSGNLKRGIVLRDSKINSPKRGGNLIGVFITLRSGSKAGLRDAFYGRFQEDGWEVAGGKRTLANTPGKFNRRGKLRLSRAATRGRSTLRTGVHVPPKNFIKGAFAKDKLNAVQMIIDAATAGAEIVAKRTGFK